MNYIMDKKIIIMKKITKYIKHIKTMFYKMMLCVSLRKKGCEKFADCEKSGKFEKNKMHMYNAAQVANWFITKGLNTNNPVNPMKLQKLFKI